ncbi:hypothetical protein CY34DRAFT_110960 [Suillus luteus UH-Slu-Lm8-n1]|uniref:Uncharacterized protein n=1 Tax=Suillus luteus UH-Slu-Lm8-n1 TaxID=930992 RepID=A0A0C9Z4X6_9AGAM|nr:hypothetical protein CY34DRAFT_110960 [Suillus luteus UH-Slu-Lm8-n1]
MYSHFPYPYHLPTYGPELPKRHALNDLDKLSDTLYEDRKLLVCEMRNGIFKSGILSGYPKAINALVSLYEATPEELRDIEPLRVRTSVQDSIQQGRRLNDSWKMSVAMIAWDDDIGLNQGTNCTAIDAQQWMNHFLSVIPFLSTRMQRSPLRPDRSSLSLLLKAEESVESVGLTSQEVLDEVYTSRNSLERYDTDLRHCKAKLLLLAGFETTAAIEY